MNDKNELIKIVCRGDLKKNKKFYLSSKDDKNRLLVGASIGTRCIDKERAKKLIDAEVDVLIIDSSNGAS